MTEREKFEKWCKANKYTALYFSDNMYFDKATQMAWKAWQASRANMPKIKLPGVNFSSTFYVDIENRVINKCKQAIHEAGYEVE